MASTFNIGVVWYCLFYFVAYSANATKTFFEIERGKYDTFRNLDCHTSQSCDRNQCESYRAECVDNKCERCRCSKDGRHTFVASGSNTGNCTKDENIIPIPGGEYIKNSKGECLGVKGEELINVPCSENDLSLRWQRSRLLNLLNVKALKCLQWKNDSQEFAVAQCKEASEMQQWFPFGLRFREITLGTNIKAKPLYSNLSFETPASPYTGCYRFQNESFMLYLDDETCRENPCSYQFFSPIFASDSKRCDVRLTQNLTKPLFFIKRTSVDTQTLTVNRDALKIFNGSLLRLHIKCGIEKHCLLLKFKSLRWNTKTNPIVTTAKLPTTTAPPPPTTKVERNPTITSPTSSSTLLIVMSVLASCFVVILLAIFLHFVCYRRHKSNKSKFFSRVQTVEELPDSSSSNDQPASGQSQNYVVPMREHDNQNS